MRRITRPLVTGTAQHRVRKSLILRIMSRMKVVQADARPHMTTLIDKDLCKKGARGQSDQGTHKLIEEATGVLGSRISVTYQGSAPSNHELLIEITRMMMGNVIGIEMTKMDGTKINKRTATTDALQVGGEE